MDHLRDRYTHGSSRLELGSDNRSSELALFTTFFGTFKDVILLKVISDLCQEKTKTASSQELSCLVYL